VNSPFSDLDRPPLRVETLARALVRPGSIWRDVRVLASTPSTNAAVAAESAGPEGLVVVAEHQRSGRGRLDRVWTSPPRAGLTFSVLLRPDVPDVRWSWLPLLAGLAVAEALEDMSGVEVGLKWPNDLLVDERKVGGILVERHGDAAVVGVGINVTTTDEELAGVDGLPDGIAATSLLLADAAVTDRESLLRAVLRALAHRYAGWRESSDPSALASAYAERCTTIDRDVTVAMPDGSALTGRATRVDDDGRLVVTSADGEHAVSSGDVKHVRTA
jgi:BirA family biotin operon repressor/biotin-[acetyl-CoA-carboxylase] ligase